MFKRSASIFVIFIVTFLLATPAFASEQGPNDATAPEDGGMGGVVVPQGQQKMLPELGGGNLIYHNGRVMHTNRTFAIYWALAGYGVSATYRAHINQFFKDVAAASGATSNVYYSLTQYFSLPGPSYITTNSSFGGYYNDSRTFPADACALYAGVTKCLSDAQIRAEIKRVITLKGWVANTTNLFFMFTPNGVGSCFGSDCAFTEFCAYHSYAGAIIYANQPYTYTVPGACGVPASPNGDFPSDSTLNVVSHEHREAMNDYHLNAWYDNLGYEGSDKCAWIFGPLTIGYNQTINGHHYVLQKDWSNATSRCRLSGH